MESNELQNLEKFYKKLCDSILIQTKKSTKSKSPIMLFLKTQKKNILKILKGSGIPKTKINDDILSNLLNKNWIRPSDRVGEFLITPRGIWEYETYNNLFKIEDYIDFIDKEFFDLFKSQEKLFDAKECIVIFGMIAIRAFSQNSWVDTNNDKNSNYWIEIFDKSRKNLLELGIITQTEFDNFWKRKKKAQNDNFKEDTVTDPVFYLLRHMNDLPAKTNDIFKFSGNKQYYLDLPENQNSFKESLIFLLKKIFEKRENFELNEDININIINFFKEISLDYSIYVFDIDSHKFSTPEFDAFLRDIVIFL